MATPRVQLFVNTADNISNEAATDIDTDKLLDYLASNIDDFKIDPSNTLELHRFTSGYMNAPYLMKYGQQRYVLRRDADIPAKDPTLMGLKQSSTLRKTYDIMNAIGQNTNIPVPKMLIYCDDIKVIGLEFYIMDFVDGRIFYNTADTDTESDGAPLSDKDRNEMHTEIAKVLSDIHCVDVIKCGLIEIFQKYNTMELQYVSSVMFEKRMDEINEFIKLKNKTVESQLAQQYLNELSVRLKIEEIENKRFRAFQKFDDFDGYDDDDDDIKKSGEKEIKFLKHNLIHNDLTLIHGDTQWENIIWHKSENKIIAMVDWEFCCIGNPMLEVVYNTIIWSMFAGLNFYHFQKVKKITEMMVNQELMKHIDNMSYIRQQYAKALKSKNKKLYDIYIRCHGDIDRVYVNPIYDALIMWRFGADFVQFHCVVNEEELTEKGRMMMKQFPIGLGPYFFQIGFRLMGIVPMDNNNDKNNSTDKAVYDNNNNNNNKSIRIVNELLIQLLEYEINTII